VHLPNVVGEVFAAQAFGRIAVNASMRTEQSRPLPGARHSVALMGTARRGSGRARAPPRRLRVWLADV